MTLSDLYREKLSLIEMPADENFRFVRDTRAIDEAVCAVLDAAENPDVLNIFARAHGKATLFKLQKALFQLRETLEKVDVEI